LPTFYRGTVAKPVVEAENLGKRYRLFKKPVHRLASWLSMGIWGKYEDIWALQELDLTIRLGETVGVIGVNGAGKSTLLKLISGTTYPTTGSILVQGRAAALLELGAGFHPEFTGRENVRLNAALLGFSHADIRKREEQILEFSGLGEFADRPVKTYSSGMVVRLGFSVASHLDPDILLVDEALAVGDEAFRVKCLERFNLFREAGKTLVFVSHDLRLVRTLCNRAILLDGGRLVADGNVENVVRHYLHLVEKRQAEKDSMSASAAGEAVHRGSGEILIEQVSLKNGSGESTSQFFTGKPFEIRIRYRANKDIDAPIFLIHVISSDGTLCIEIPSVVGQSSDFSKHGREAMRQHLTPVREGETGELGFRTSELLLLTGDYYLNVYAFDLDQPLPIALDEISRASEFSVSGVVSHIGVFLHPGEWTRIQ
jgi:lipopolysaccharide transport system ATP-binding protein